MKLQKIAKKNILIVDDDAEFRSSIHRILRISGYQVSEASDGEEALASIRKSPPDAILSDYKMPKMNGGELIVEVRKLGSIPFLLMTGVSNVMEATEAYAAGAAAFLSKPFQRDDLLRDLRRALGEEVAGESDGDFCKLWVGDFVNGSQIRFPIYLKLSDSKFVKLGNSGEDLSRDRIERLISKNIRHLYLKTEDFRKYVELNAQMTAAVVSSTKISDARKREFLRHTAEVVFEFVNFKKIDQELFESVSNTLEVTLGLLGENSDVFSILLEYIESDNERFSHGIGCALLSAMIGRYRKWEAPSTITRLMLAGLLHDIGESKLPSILCCKMRNLLTPEELRIYQTHPALSRDILAELTSVTPDLATIVYQHHEAWDGSGFPQGISGKNIHPLARIVSVADSFIKLQREFGEEGMPNLLNRMKQEYGATLDPSLLKILFTMMLKT